MEDFLRLLGHDLSSTISIRAFYPRTDSRAKTDKSKKHFDLELKMAIRQAQKLNAEGRSVYVIVNGAGKEDKDIKQCRALFYEHDDLSKELSVGLWEGLGLPRPSFQVDTGGKSIHSYWVLNKPIAPDLWKPLQTDLIEFADGDRQCKNPSRVMRCPGYVHPETGQMAALINITEQRYSFDELRAIVPVVERQAPRVALDAIASNGHISDDGVSIAAFLAVDNRRILDGVSEGSRNGSLHKLGLDLVGVERWLQQEGIYPRDRAWDLFHGACAKCNPPMGSVGDDPQPDEFWLRIVKDSNGPSLSDDKLRNILRVKTRKPMSKSDRNGHGESAGESLESKFAVQTLEKPEDFSFLERPLVEIIPGHLDKICSKIIDVLSIEQNGLSRVYYQGLTVQWLTRLLSTAGNVDCCEPMTLDKVRNMLDKKFRFFKRKKTEDSDDKKIFLDCPPDVARHLFNESRWPGIAKLEGIIKLPYLESSGRISLTNGYDKESGFFTDFNPKKFKLKPEPTKNDAEDALECLRDLMSEFCFADEVSRSGALAMVLTVVSRTTYSLAPLFAINANSPGSGKGTLTDVVAILATGGTESGKTTFHPEPVELKKQIISTLQSGSPVIVFDNIEDVFGGASIESCLTAPFFGGRILGRTEDVKFSTRALWVANGNGLQLTKDMLRRTIRIDLDLKEENPDDRKFSRNILQYTYQNREQIAGQALTLLQAYLREKPQIDTPLMSSFEDWSRLVRNALIWLGVKDPVQKAAEKELDEKTVHLCALLEAWYEVKGEQSTKLKDFVKTFANEAYEEVKEALIDVALDRRTGQISSNLLGYYLRKNKKVRVGDKRFVQDEERTDRLGIYWKIEKF